ncbi:MAG: cell division protein ZapB [Candidatus Zixiibacteriota bacterium]|nr:MAG: cell division protein ZapB [candidate division Zixibacteria bacterium]
MQLENFEKLEEKIRQTVELINKLKAENQEITTSYRQLEDQISNFQKGSKSLGSEAEKLKKEFASRERDFEKKKKEIKRRLEKLLERLVPFEAGG